MPESTRRLVDAMTYEVVETEGMARDLAEIAHDLDEDGCKATAQIFRDMSRKLRVKGLERRSNLAALIVEHDK